MTSGFLFPYVCGSGNKGGRRCWREVVERRLGRMLRVRALGLLWRRVGGVASGELVVGEGRWVLAFSIDRDHGGGLPGGFCFEDVCV